MSEELASKPRGYRLFVLAHEGSHSQYDDTEASRAFIEKHVSPLATFSEMSVQYQAIRGELQKAAKARESRADRAAYLALRKAGIDARQDVIAMFKEHEHADTQWHPSAKDRLFALLKLK